MSTVSYVPSVAVNCTVASGFTVADAGAIETCKVPSGTVTAADPLREGSAALVATR